MTAANAGHAFGVVVVDELARAGATDVCLAPGSRSTPLALAFADDDRIRVHVSIDERSASFLALGLAKATRRAVALLCTSGTAAANFHPAVLEAHESRVPLIVFTADRPPELRHTGANQTVDQLHLYGRAVRWFCEVGVPESHPGAVRYWRSLAARTWAAAHGSPPGPVHLNVSFREPLVPVPDDAGFPHPLEGRSDGRPWTETRPAARLPADADIEIVLDAAARSRRGALVAGACDVDAAPLVELAETAGWPVLAEPSSGLRAGANAVSTYDACLRLDAFRRAYRPDLVIRIGKHGTSKSLAALLTADISQIAIDPDGAWIDPDRTAARVIACDPSLLAREVAKAIDARDETWVTSWRAAERAAREAIDAILDADEIPSEPRTARDVAALAPTGSSLVVATSMPVRDLESFMAPRSGVRVLANRGANGIDGFVSTALGIAVGTTGPTTALCGDLALLHDQNGLLGARREESDLTIVVVNNDGGGIFSFLPQADLAANFELLFGTPHGIDFERLAALYGCDYVRLHRASQLTEVMASQPAGVRVVEVRTDRTANVELHRRIWDAIAHAVAPLV